jgi:hypothetical protein
MTSWRKHLKMHPAAELFPPMSEPELRELGEDIKAHGLRTPIVLCNNKLLDGRNRLDAMELVGIKFTIGLTSAKFKKDDPAPVFREYLHGGDPYNYVLSANIHRRHLTDEQRRELIAKIIKAKPEASDRAIAKQVKRDHKTVANVRRTMESTGEVSPVEKRVGADGKKRKKPAKKRPVETNQERRDREECVALAEKAKAADPEFAEWLSGPKQQRAAKPRARSVSAQDTALQSFTARALELVRLTRGQGANRFAKTALPDEGIRQLAKLFSDLAKIRCSGLASSAEVSVEQRKAEHKAAS